VDPGGLDELLARAGQQDPAALAELVERYSRRVYGLVYRLCGDRDVADDLLQETFLRVVKRIGDYEHSGRFEAWLFRIAANLARDRARQRTRRGEPLSLEAPADERPYADPAAAEPGPDERLATDDARQQLAACIDGLSPADREIIVLRHYADLSFREIAEMLRIPLGTALARGHRALGRLKAAMQTEETW
jgi:RNA polymerase sigma-70 factor (ECF subfamily)